MDLLETYLDYTTDTEPPTNFHRWSFISVVSARLSRRLWIPFGHGKIFPNMYVLLVGVPGTRKSTAINISKEVLKDSEYPSFSFSKTSKEKFLMDLEEGFATRKADGTFDMMAALEAPLKVDNREVYICCDEFVDFIGVHNVNFINLLTTLWDNLPDYNERLKNSKSVNIVKPTVNMLGGITPITFSSAMPPEVIGQGFMSRLILIHGEPKKKKITWPKAPDEVIKKKLSDFLKEIDTYSGPVTISKEADVLLDKIYQKWENMPDARLQYYGARRFTHLLKLCIVGAVLEGGTILSGNAVMWANTILTHTERTMHLALGEFGESKHSKAMQKIVETLSLHNRPLSLQELWAAVNMDLDRVQQLGELLMNLSRADKIKAVETKNEEGMKVTNYIPAEQKHTRVTIATDFEKYIREYEDPETLNLEE